MGYVRWVDSGINEQPSSTTPKLISNTNIIHSLAFNRNTFQNKQNILKTNFQLLFKWYHHRRMCCILLRILTSFQVTYSTWRRHYMEILFALPPPTHPHPRVGNSSVIWGFPNKRLVMRSFDVFFVVYLVEETVELLVNWDMTLWPSCDVTIMIS